ncbi:flagellar filament capping protein FliD [Clostridium tagluense]|uniref:flagellar filament capping protein FliD n=1 Tax=Clostridium tagluense TaxID=360422 RepID=UPI001CF16945|nr:flagellar filament capping protein FliD [Clostridium tagluense]MCB2310037.1 flagellar filament capping protein FliD [Clostridium tagluense]MCB2314433.1 flagellar filament capping protein FliD [Clostridium tagluense]MCB2319279.1 flagellar filament capping protein FliD [Clostridium tagluense]MCB2324631.1 flagellar filament capping protein FliD [Clostridium tagluense]MCB2329482.1 flagellar filament capping protein FliD [Clostridium tagluense]
MGNLRITGMATGMDTDATIKQMMKPYTMKVDKMKQDRQIVAWKQELYRDILADTSTIKDTYFDNLRPDTNMLSKNNYAGFDVTSNNVIAAQSAGVSAKASVGAVAGSYSVYVDKLASAAKVEGVAINESNAAYLTNSVEGKITFEVGGTKPAVEIIVPVGKNKDELIAYINGEIAGSTSLKGKLIVSAGAGESIKFSALTNDSVKVDSDINMNCMTNLKGKVINPNRYTTKLSDLGIEDGGTLTFDYKDSNGITKKSNPITVSKDATISQLIDAVNQGTSGAVKLNFSELTGKFSMESLQTGSSALLNVTEDGGKGVLTKLNLNAVSTPGINAKVTITPPGIGAVAITVEKPGNTFSIDGVNYTLTQAGTTNNITVTGNSQKTYDKIKGFIDKYNELVDKVSQKIDEKKQYKFLPLSDEQKKDMKEDEIKQWDIKAKVGLLKGDSSLEGMLNSMRSAFFQGVEGAGISLSEIGLSTSPDTTQRGKIIIDEKKLKTAIETRGEQVANLFAKNSTTYSSYSQEASSTERSTRNKEQGIFQRINDILQDYTKATGKKGILIEKAGIKGDTKSFLSEDIIKKDKKINEMIKSLAARENSYYLKFSKLEVAMNKLNSQSSWLTQQLGGGK